MNEANTLADVIGHDPAFPRDPQCPAPSPSIAEALDRLKTAMRMDPGYAWSWHCNVAMPILDTRRVPHGPLIFHSEANEMAANVMRHLFDVDVRASREWAAMFKTPQLHENGDGR
jgi:hypothetical protein